MKNAAEMEFSTPRPEPPVIKRAAWSARYIAQFSGRPSGKIPENTEPASLQRRAKRARRPAPAVMFILNRSPDRPPPCDTSLQEQDQPRKNAGRSPPRNPAHSFSLSGGRVQGCAARSRPECTGGDFSSEAARRAKNTTCTFRAGSGKLPPYPPTEREKRPRSPLPTILHHILLRV